MTREELITWATANDWKLDRFGHLHKVEEEGLRHYRLKLSRIAARFEIKTTENRSKPNDIRKPSKKIRRSRGD